MSQSPNPAMTERYWNRLRSLLESALILAESSLRPTAEESPAADKGISGQVAHSVQGLSEDAATVVIAQNAQSVEWNAEWAQGTIASLVNYGLGPGAISADIISWFAEKLSPVKASISVWEADVSALSVECADRILKVRSRLRAFRGRIELCARIIAALEGRGRRVQTSLLDKLKLQFEKAESVASKQEERRKAQEERAAAAERARVERSRRKEEKEFAKGESERKMRRQATAQASFMRHFVKTRVTTTKKTAISRVISNNIADGSSTRSIVIDDESPVEIMGQVSSASIVPYDDLCVMPVRLWLLLQMDFIPSSTAYKELSCTDAAVGRELVLKHLSHCGRKRRAAERKLGVALINFRNQRVIDRDDRAPRFSALRADLRGRCNSHPKKILQFDENIRPAFVGTMSRRSSTVCGRRPFVKDSLISYDYDSADEWEEEDEDGESLSDVEAEKEREREDAELRKLYGSDDESDDDFLDDENVCEEEDDAAEDDLASNDEFALAGTGQRAQLQANLNSSESSAGLYPVVIDVDADVNVAEKKRLGPLFKTEINGAKRKRRKKANVDIAKVEVIGIDFCGPEFPSVLDKYAVSRHVGGPEFALFDPATELRSLGGDDPGRSRTPATRLCTRVTLDEQGRLDFAAVIMANAYLGRDRIIEQFCQQRRLAGEFVPTKTELLRVLSELALKEKRAGDHRMRWYTKDSSLAVCSESLHKEAEIGLSDCIETHLPTSSLSVSGQHHDYSIPSVIAATDHICSKT